MPFLAPLAVAVSSAWASLGAVTILGIKATSIIATAVTVGASIGLNYYQTQQAKRKARRQTASLSTSQEYQQTLRQATAPRFRSYGTVKVGGIFAFQEARNGYLYSLIVTGQGTIAGIDEFWLNDRQVLTDASNQVITAPFLSGGLPVVTIEWRRGFIEQPASALLLEAFSEWTIDHKLLGLPWTLLRYQQVPADSYQTVYNGQAPSFRQVHRAALIYDPRDEAQDWDDANTWVWSDNPALILLDYMTHREGMGLSRTLLDPDSFGAAADACDELVPLKEGGAERRYRASGSYNLDVEPKTVVQSILDTCRGEIRLLPNGKVGLEIGRYDEAPAITVTPDFILSWDILRKGALLGEFNGVKPIYTSPDHDYQEIEGEPFYNLDSVETLGRTINEDFRLPWVTSFTQARRLSKIELYEDNPEWSGSIVLNAFGLNLLDQRLFRLQIEELGIDHICRNRGVSIAEDLTTVRVEFATLDPRAYEWNPDTDEGTPPPVTEETGITNSLSIPLDVRVVTGVRGGTMTGGIAWQPPDNPSLATDVRWRVVGGSYSTAQVPAGTHGYEFSPLTDGLSYEAEVRHIDATGNVSAWSGPTFVAADDTEAPPIPATFTVTGGVEQAVVRFSGGGGTTWAIEVVAAADGASMPSFGSPLVRRVGLPTASNVVTVVQPSGERDFWARAVSIAGVASATTIGPIDATVTDAPPPPDVGGGGAGSGDGGFNGGGEGNTGGGYAGVDGGDPSDPASLY